MSNEQKTKHTPGPYSAIGDDGIDITIIGEGDEVVAEIPILGDQERADANAALFIAAPELLAAGLAVISTWEHGDLAGVVRQLNAATTKAEG